MLYSCLCQKNGSFDHCALCIFRKSEFACHFSTASLHAIFIHVLIYMLTTINLIFNLIIINFFLIIYLKFYFTKYTNTI